MIRKFPHVFLLVAVVCIALLGAQHSQASQDGKKKKLNFVFILVDDMGWTDAGCLGSKFYETPNIDKLAKTGMKFTDGYAACPVCSPTRASIMTGKYPARMDITNFFTGRRKGMLLPAEYRNSMPLSEFTLAEAMQAAGYRTAFIGKWHLGGEGFEPTRQGFDINIAGNHRGSPPSYFSPYRNPQIKDGPKGEYLTDRLTTEGLKFMEKNKDNPFFLYLSYYTVHIPLQAKKDIIAKYREKAAKNPAKGPKFLPEINGKKVRQVHDHATYAAMIDILDTNVGRILQKLDELGIDDNTVVIFTADNGGLSTAEGLPTANVPLRTGKGWLYEGGIREPWIIRWPGVTEPGSVCDVPVISTDFYPTILDIAGLKSRPKQHVDGVSFAPLLRGKGKIPERALFWHYPHYSNQGGRPGSSVRQGKYVLIENFEDDSLELYDLEKDLSQKNNLAKKMPDPAMKMLTLLRQWRQEVGANMPRPNPNWKGKKKKR